MSNMPVRSVDSIADSEIESPHHRKMLQAIIDALNGSEKLVFIDLFCGAGGMSEGLAQCLENIADALNVNVEDFAVLHAVNHDPVAIETHMKNHPWATHYERPIQQVEPTDLVDRDTVVHLLLAAPDCTFHSPARGGGPKDRDARMQPREVLIFAETLNVRNVLVENVPALRGWGPLDEDNHVIKEKKGEHFDHWLKGFSIEGFNIEHKVICCADFGDATTRRRLFIAGRKDGGVSWPEPTHSEDGHGDTKRWRTAADIIDWNDLGESLWVRDLRDGRRSPLVNRTMERIAQGLREHCGDELEPFAEIIEEIGRSNEDVKYPLPTLRERIVDLNHAATAAKISGEPFLVSYGQGTNSSSKEVAGVTGLRGSNIASFLLRQHDGDGVSPLNIETSPLPTIAKAGAISKVSANQFVLPRDGLCRGKYSNPAFDPDDRPLQTIIASDIRQGYSVTPLLMQYSHSGSLLSTDQPLPTITTAKGGVMSLAMPTPSLIPFYSERDGQKPRTHNIETPHPTIPASKIPTGVANPFLIEYYNSDNARALTPDRPVPTIPTKDRFALVIPELFPLGLNIGFRMLKPEELAAAHSFPDNYEFADTKTKTVEQIGNSVPVRTAAALCREMLIGQKTTLSDFLSQPAGTGATTTESAA